MMKNIFGRGSGESLGCMSEPLGNGPFEVYLESLGGSQSRRTVRWALGVAASILSGEAPEPACLKWWDAKYYHGQRLRSRLLKKYTPGIGNQIIGSYRQVLRRAGQMGKMTQAEVEAACRIDKIKGRSAPAGRHLSPAEINSLFAAAQGAVRTPERDTAILAVLYGAGLRRSEIGKLELGDYDPESGKMNVKGKGGREELVYLNRRSREAMADWVVVRGFLPGYLFCRVGGAGSVPEKGLTGQAIYIKLCNIGAKAGIEHFSPHDLRRTFVGDLLDAGVDLSTVQKMARHRDPNTTARYDRRGVEVRKDAAERLHIPYRSLASDRT